jgi:putative ABC transport system permease protein
LNIQGATFGNLSQIMSLLGQDLRNGVRLLSKSRGFTAIALATLALGIGAAVSIFSVADAVMFKPLPVRDPNRVVVVYEKNPALNKFRMPAAVVNFRDWRQQSQTLQGVSAIWGAPVNLTGGPNGYIDPEELKAERVSAGLLPMLGVQPILGRVFRTEEDRPGHNNFAMLSHSLWVRKFGSDPAIVGKNINLRNQPYDVVGIMPAGFNLLEPEVDVYVPLGLNANDPRMGASRMLTVLARLKPGVTLAQAKNEMEGIGAQLETANPAVRGWRPNLFPLQEELLGKTRDSIWVLLGAVSCLVLMACVNVANLLLARGASRQREIAVRAAVGASRSRLVAQFLTESVMLALAGGAAGLLLAGGAVRLVSRLGPVSIPRLTEVRMDVRLLLFALAVSLVTGILFGIVPALQGSRGNVSAALMEGGRSGTAGRSARWLRSALVVAEIALALVVLIGAGLLMRAFERLRTVDPGFRSASIFTMRIPLGGGRNNAPERRVAFFQQLTDKIATLPGVLSVGAVSALPLTGFGNGSLFWIEGRPAPPPERRPLAATRGATPTYFRTMGIPLLEGRDFGARDTADSAPVAIIDETLARRFWPQGGAVGARLASDANDKVEEIVGVVGKVKPDRLDSDDLPTIYMPYSQKRDPTMIVVARTANAPLSLASAAARSVHDLDSQQPVADVRTMDQIVDDAVAGARFNTMVLDTFAVIAFLLAAVGIYGVVSYDVTSRTNEIGVRVAFGASERDVLKLVVGQAARLAVLGIAIGLAAAYELTTLMRSMLFGVNPRDFYTFAAVAALLGVLAIGASYIPSRRAAALDPLGALRHE